MNKKFCSGSGNDSFIEMMNQCYAHFTPTGEIPNLSMLLNGEYNLLVEGAFWRGFWIQNSYGVVFNSIPFLQEPFFEMMQNSMDLFWDRIGDGQRMGYDSHIPEEGRQLDHEHARKLCELVAPDGCLGDAVMFVYGYGMAIAFRQGDSDIFKHDWFYEATVAGVLMQAEILLRKVPSGLVESESRLD